jgi:trehalose 6-phosphate phosphatase
VTEKGSLAPLLEDLGRTGVFSDFDGTLAPIVDDPEDARPLPGVAETLSALANRAAQLGHLGGRPAEFLLRHISGPGVSLWGLHGLETVEDGRVVPVPEAEEWRPVVERLTERARSELGGAVDVEPKTVALTLHFRRSSAEAERAQQWAEEAAEETGLVLHPGRKSAELRPPVEHSKGLALESAAEGLEAACFFGDDWGDVAAFEALDRLAAKGVRTVKVGVQSEEAPDALLEQADVVADGPAGVLELLRSLL